MFSLIFGYELTVTFDGELTCDYRKCAHTPAAGVSCCSWCIVLQLVHRAAVTDILKKEMR